MLKLTRLFLTIFCMFVFSACAHNNNSSSSTSNADTDTNTDADSDADSDSDSDVDSDEDSSEDTSKDDAEITTVEGDIAILPDNIIDDFEDGDIQATQVQGRSGIWHLDNDGSEGGVQTPKGGFKTVPGGPGDSINCAHTTGSGFSNWGSELNVNLNTPDHAGVTETNYMPHDASEFDGIVFMAKGQCDFRLNLTTVPIAPNYYGGDCDPDKQDCFDAHGTPFSIDHPNEWRQYKLEFDKLAQTGWGLQEDFDPTQILAVQYSFTANTEFNLAVDNIAFYSTEK